MGQLATRTKKTPHVEIMTNPTVTENKAGGVSFEITDPAEYLLATIGSSMFTEPKYYPDNVNFKEKKTVGYNTDGLDEQAVDIIEACIKISETATPRDLLALANWCRTEMHMRTTPCIMTAVAARCGGTKKFVKKYVPRIAQRPDDIKQIVAAYEHLFGWKGFPACLKKGVAEAVSKVNEYGFMKYNTDGHPSWKDILCFVERKKDYPVSKEVLEYLMNGKIVDAKKTPVFAARHKLNALKEWTDEVPELAKKSKATWEVLVSQFGNKPEVWKAVIPMMGYMALLRNLSNFLDADIDLGLAKSVAKTLSDKDAVLKSRQLPFRFFAAHRVLNPDMSRYDPDAKDRRGWNDSKLTAFLDALDDAMEISVENMAVLPGSTCIAVDTSGSMDISLSEKSTISVKDAGLILAALAFKSSARAGGDVHCAAFATEPAWPRLSKRDSVITIMKKLAKADTKGWSTDAYKVINHLIKKKIKVDRIVLLSDMQCYGTRSVGEKLIEYRRKINPKCVLHSVHLNGHDNTTQAPRNGKGKELNNIISGFHQNMFAQLVNFENPTTPGIQTADDDVPEAAVQTPQVIPTMAYIRENY